MTRRKRARRVLEALRTAIPRPETELQYRDPYELLIAVILSAQCTDARVNKVTLPLFEAFPTVETLARATPEDVYPYVKSVTYPNSKARYLAGAARMIVEDFGGKVPQTIEGLRKLPGVGRKTAQVVASVAYEVDALPVDTHVFRVANRIGLVKRGADTPLKVERQLKSVILQEDWGEAHHLLILHGRYTCTARSPACETCPVRDYCTYYRRLQRLPDPLDGLDAGRGALYCKTCGRYFDEHARHIDRYGTEQVACSSCGSMNVYRTTTGATTKTVRDYRVG